MYAKAPRIKALTENAPLRDLGTGGMVTITMDLT